MPLISTLISFLITLAIICVVFRLLHFSVKVIIKLAINALVGCVILFLINLIPGVTIVLTWWKGLLVGLFGVPAVILFLILSFI